MRVILVMVAAVVAVAALVPVPVTAETIGSCTVNINGADASSRDSSDPGDAIAVAKGRPVTFQFASPHDITSWTAHVELGPITSHLADGGSDAATPAHNGTVPVETFQWMGAGLYLITTDVRLGDGSTCRASALIDVQANPLTTAMGAGSAAAAVLGLAGVLGVARYAARGVWAQAAKLG